MTSSNRLKSIVSNVDWDDLGAGILLFGFALLMLYVVIYNLIDMLGFYTTLLVLMVGSIGFLFNYFTQKEVPNSSHK